MTGMELSTVLRCGLNPIVVVLNNHGYGTERPMQDGEFNNILRWRYAELPRVIGSGLGIKANTEREMAAALEKAHAERFPAGPSFKSCLIAMTAPRR